MKAKLTNSKSIEEVIKYIPFKVKISVDYKTFWNKQ